MSWALRNTALYVAPAAVEVGAAPEVPKLRTLALLGVGLSVVFSIWDFVIRHYINAIDDIVLLLTKR